MEIFHMSNNGNLWQSGGSFGGDTGMFRVMDGLSNQLLGIQMEAAIALGIFFLPAILYLMRVSRPDKVDVLLALVGSLVGVSVLGQLGTFLWPGVGGPAFALAGWLGLLVFALRRSPIGRKEERAKK